jgi:type IV pilus assembly protein PilV
VDERHAATDRRRACTLRRLGARSQNEAMKFPVPAPSRRRFAFRGQRHEPGFTLLEVLVAIVVLSFGVLGVVGLQATAMQANREARNQSAAVALDRELGDLMRGNKDVALNTTASQNPYLLDTASALPTSTADCYSAACGTTLAVAQFNMQDWVARAQATLPGSRIVVCFDEDPYNDTTGRPQWACSAGATTLPGNVVVKIGWTRQSTNTASTTAERVTGTGATGLPSVILPLVSGSTQ